MWYLFSYSPWMPWYLVASMLLSWSWVVVVFARSCRVQLVELRHGVLLTGPLVLLSTWSTTWLYVIFYLCIGLDNGILLDLTTYGQSNRFFGLIKLQGLDPLCEFWKMRSSSKVVLVLFIRPFLILILTVCFSDFLCMKDGWKHDVHRGA